MTPDLYAVAKDFGVPVLGLFALGWWAVRVDNLARLERDAWRGTIDGIRAALADLHSAVENLATLFGGSGRPRP